MADVASVRGNAAEAARSERTLRRNGRRRGSRGADPVEQPAVGNVLIFSVRPATPVVLDL